MSHKRLFIPGPTEVRVENLAALARPQIGHRSAEFVALYRSVVPKLKETLPGATIEVVDHREGLEESREAGEN